MDSKLATHLQNNLLNDPVRYPDITTKITFQLINVEFVQKQLSAMQKGKATGLDNLYTWLFKDAFPYYCSTPMSDYECTLKRWYNTIHGHGLESHLSTNQIKSQILGILSPYLLCYVLWKYLKELYNQLSSYMRNEGPPCDEHSGFQPKQSTCITLIHMTDDILYTMDKGKLAGAGFWTKWRILTWLTPIISFTNYPVFELLLPHFNGLIQIWEIESKIQCIWESSEIKLM